MCSPLFKPGRVRPDLSICVVLTKEAGPSRLILHGQQTSKIVPLLMQPAFSPSLVCLLAHPSVLITHLAREYLTPPPPVSSDSKFWGVFLPVSERHHECERLVFGSAGEGTGSTTEFVVEILVRGLHAFGGKRGLERTLEGWSSSEGHACELTKLGSFKTLLRKNEAIGGSEV
jgi:elongator complex protein 5